MSFRARVTSTLALFGLTILLCITTIYYFQVKQALFQTLDDALKRVARAELASALDDPEEGLHIHNSESPGYANLETELEQVSWIINSTGRVLAKSANVDSQQIETVMERLKIGSGDERVTDQDIDGSSYRLLATELEVGGQRYVEVLGLSREPVLAKLLDIQKQIAALLLLSAILLPLVANALSKRLTDPVRVLAGQLEKIGQEPQNTLVRPLKPVDHEIRVLYSSVEEMLQRLDESLETQKRFVSDASHEIRAPLTNLRVALDVCLRKERTCQDYREVLQTCQHEVVRLGLLADRLLTLNRIDSGLYQLDCQPMELRELVSNSVAVFSARARDLGIEIDFSSTDDCPLDGDTGAIRQVVDNLLNNALCYAPRGSTIEIAVEALEDSVKFQITNAGCQLTPKQAKKVFERFYRVDVSRQRDTGGAGLGLAIAAGFVTAHGGKIGIQLGKESLVTFWFTLPRPSNTSPQTSK